MRRPTKSTPLFSSAASKVYKRPLPFPHAKNDKTSQLPAYLLPILYPVPYTHPRAHEIPAHFVSGLLLEKKKNKNLFNGPYCSLLFYTSLTTRYRLLSHLPSSAVNHI